MLDDQIEDINGQIKEKKSEMDEVVHKAEVNIAI